MIRPYIVLIRSWYEHLELRERALFMLLSWSLLYAIVYLILFNPLDKAEMAINNDIKSYDEKIKSWHTQIDALNKIPSTPLYKEWIKNQGEYKGLEGQYRSLLNNFSLETWQQVLQTVLQTQQNVTTVQIKNSPETAYNPGDPAISKSTIYQQKLLITVNGSYFNVINYLQKLEKSLPNIHWDTLDYQVENYPIGKVDMEFSVFYEKTH